MTVGGTVETPTRSDLDGVFEVAQQLRVDGIRASTRAGSGHPTSSMSAADLIAVLAARHLRYDFDDPGNPAHDHLILSKKVARNHHKSQSAIVTDICACFQCVQQVCHHRRLA